ncbi:MAG: hypothetical protein U0166_05265 [Acidobacteriota bacterium]
MKTFTVRLPESIVAEIEAESRARHVSKSDIARERLSARGKRDRKAGGADTIADLVGSVGGLPEDLSRRRKAYLRSTRYGLEHSR